MRVKKELGEGYYGYIDPTAVLASAASHVHTWRRWGTPNEAIKKESFERAFPAPVNEDCAKQNEMRHHRKARDVRRLTRMHTRDKSEW